MIGEGFPPDIRNRISEITAGIAVNNKAITI